MGVLSRRWIQIAWLVAVLTCATPLPAEDLGLRVPEGFEVSLYAGDDLAHDIYSMTLDSQGRVVVAGRDYVKILHDDDRDGRADRATLFSSRPGQRRSRHALSGRRSAGTGDDSLMLLRDSDGTARPMACPKIGRNCGIPNTAPTASSADPMAGSM